MGWAAAEQGLQAGARGRPGRQEGAVSMVTVQWCSEDRSKPLTALFQFTDLKISLKHDDAKCLTVRPARALPAAGCSLSQGTPRPAHLESRHPLCQQHSKATARHEEDSFSPGKGETQSVQPAHPRWKAGRQRCSPTSEHGSFFHSLDNGRCPPSRVTAHPATPGSQWLRGEEGAVGRGCWGGRLAP